MNKLATGVLLALSLGGCATTQQIESNPPSTFEITPVHNELRELPPPERKVVVAVYDYTDQTGQYKPSENITSYSRAVTQGATSILIKALQDAGRGRWFTVVERSRLNNLLKERQIIKEMRKRYGEAEQGLPPMLFAGLILEGGIISFDSNTKTGGVGARYLGIGAGTEYRQDTVTVYLRATSTQSGEILKSVMTRKTIASFGVSASVFKFVSFKELLEVEAGYTSNEPGQEAIKQAIEKAVYALIAEGAHSGLWAFRNEQQGQQIIDRYKAEKYQQPIPNLQASAPQPHLPVGEPRLTQDSGNSDVVQCDDNPITRSSKHSTALATSTSIPSGQQSEVTSL